jgi:ATP-binding cassette subfamily B protein
MISALKTVVTGDGQRAVNLLILCLFLEAVLSGLAYGALVPLMQSWYTGDMAGAYGWFAVFASLSLIYVVLRFFTQTMGYNASFDIAGQLFRVLREKLSILPVGWFSGDRAGHLSGLMGNGVVSVMELPAHLLRPVVSGFVTPLMLLIIMFGFDWQLAAAASFTVPFAYLAHKWTGTRMRRSDARVQSAAQESTDRLVEFARTQPVLRSFGQAGTSFEKLSEALEEQRRAAHAQARLVGPGIITYAIIVQVCFVALIIVGNAQVTNGHMGPAEYIALMVLVVRLVEPLIFAADLAGSLKVAGNRVSQIQAIVQSPVLPEPTVGMDPGGYEICFSDVDFAHNELEILKNASFTASPREVTALVGPSGSGKSTVLQLIARFFDVQSGAITIGGVDIRDISSDRLNSMIAFVTQNDYIFEGTIETNIRMGCPNASTEEVKRAVLSAGVEEFASRFSNCLQTRVGPRGTLLSGGEKQRISIARALLKNAPILLLDEVNSALDPLNDQIVQEAIRSQGHDKTIICITHRMHTAQSADKVLYLNRGQISSEKN